jgi:hypothetical protein
MDTWTTGVGAGFGLALVSFVFGLFLFFILALLFDTLEPSKAILVLVPIKYE